MGVAAATLAPSTLSLIRNMFHDPHERTIAVSIWAMSYSAGAAIGPVVGGLLLERFWWGSVFLINVPVMLLLLAIGPALLPEFGTREGRTPGHRERRAFSRRRAGRNLWPQAHRRRRIRRHRDAVRCRRSRDGCGIRESAGATGRSPDRSAAVPHAGVQHRARRERAADFSRHSRPSCSSRNTSSPCSGCRRCRPVSGACRAALAFIAGSIVTPAIVRRFDAGAGDRRRHVR